MAEWKQAGGYEGLYEVSSDGQVRRVSGEPVGQWSNDQGYMLVRLSRPRAMLRVHRLVAMAFVANPEGKPDVNHIDCDRSNNHAENLEWCTQKENLKHSQRLGRMPRDHWRGKRSVNAQLSDDTVRQIRLAYSIGGTSWERLADRFGVSKRCVGRLIRRETYADVL